MTRLIVPTAALVIMACACLYRFNTLGGAFGGFDNDHFVHFAYAKHLEAGERPLRDFAELGLQGAWPPLTYGVSALGQVWFGDTLRSEALVTVAGVGLAAALTVAAASLLANVWWAVPATLLSVVVAPTLYNYPKVLALSAAALVVALYARRPGWATIAACAGLTATAFLFRHDYAVYVAVGIALACVLSGNRRQATRHLVVYAAATSLLLAVPLLYVQRHAGLMDYVRDSLELSRREALRTGLPEWPSPTLTTDTGERLPLAQAFHLEQNGVAWLYYLARLLPLAVLGLVWRRDGAGVRPNIRAAALAIAGMSAVSAPALIRGNIPVRLGDVGPLMAVLLAVVCHRALAAHGRGLMVRVAVVAAVAVLVSGTAMSALTVGYVSHQLQTAGMTQSIAMTRQRTSEVWAGLGALPDAALDGPAPGSVLTLSRYLNRCTAPDDRIVMLTYEPEILPFAGRLFGAGRLSVIPGFVLGERHQRVLVDRWRQQSVPVALVEFEAFFDPASPVAPLVRDHLLAHYQPAGSLRLGDRVLRVFVSRDRTATTVWPVGAESWPCFTAVGTR